jgi:hypothetical protein
LKKLAVYYENELVIYQDKKTGEYTLHFIREALLEELQAKAQLKK